MRLAKNGGGGKYSKVLIKNPEGYIPVVREYRNISVLTKLAVLYIRKTCNKKGNWM